MSDESRDATPEELANEEALRRFEAEAAFHQSNVLPLDNAMNEGRFYGLLVRGGRPLTAVQRLGFLLIAFILGAPSFFVASGAFPQWRYLTAFSSAAPAKGVSMFYLPVSALVFLVSLRIVWVALRPSAKRKINGQV
jgi:hypothetical protein